MSGVKQLRSVLSVATVLIVTSAYAATIDNPGAVEFTAGPDSRISSGSGYNMYTQNASILGSIDSNGDSFFDAFDISFDAYADPNGYTTQLQAIDDATGTYCPNSGAATLTVRARIKVTKINGSTINPCYIPIESNGFFTLTTGTSGSLTGTSFKSGSPMFVAEVDLSDVISGSCTTIQKGQIAAYYGLPAVNASFLLSSAAIDPSNLTGNGC